MYLLLFVESNLPLLTFIFSHNLLGVLDGPYVPPEQVVCMVRVHNLHPQSGWLDHHHILLFCGGAWGWPQRT